MIDNRPNYIKIEAQSNKDGSYQGKIDMEGIEKILIDTLASIIQSDKRFRAIIEAAVKVANSDNLEINLVEGLKN